MNTKQGQRTAGPKPWRIRWNGTIASMIAANGSLVEWEAVEHHCNAYDEDQAAIARLTEALEKIDALAVAHESGAIGKAQTIARAALASVSQPEQKEGA